jgi:hypothetical protein
MNNPVTKGAMQKLSVIIMLFFIAFYGCDNSTEVQSSSLSVAFFSEGSLQKVQNNTLQLNTVKALIRNLKFKNANSNDSSDIKLGPFVVNLNPSGINTALNISDIPPGAYDRVRFEVHKLEDAEAPPDPDFFDDNGSSGSERYSVIVKGTFNDNPFTYKSQRTTYQDLEFQSPIIIEDNISVNLTITVNPYSWFLIDGVYLDPMETSNESEIEMNIEHSFKHAFRDNNKDGNPD